MQMGRTVEEVNQKHMVTTLNLSTFHTWACYCCGFAFAYVFIRFVLSVAMDGDEKEIWNQVYSTITLHWQRAAVPQTPFHRWIEDWRHWIQVWDPRGKCISLCSLLYSLLYPLLSLQPRSLASTHPTRSCESVDHCWYTEACNWQVYLNGSIPIAWPRTWSKRRKVWQIDS